MPDPTEDDYYAHIEADLNGGENPSFDHVGSWEEWLRYKAALRRWIDDKDAEWTDAEIFPDA
jgi:hypothetical protein